MDWFRWVMLVFGILYAVLTPVVLAKATRCKEWQRLFDLVVLTLWVPYLFLSAVFPAIIQNAWAGWPLLRWLCLLFTLLMLANFLGFSGWLFSRRRMQKI